MVVSNGIVEQQVRKLRVTGLDRLVAGWGISEGVGIRKPDRGILEAAAKEVGQSLEGGWMVGDSPTADIEGAARAGLRTVWIRRARTWAHPEVVPTYIVDDCHVGIETVLEQGSAPA